MRYLTVIFLMACLVFSCVKKTPSNPIPEIEYKDFALLGRAGTDSAVFTIGYYDWDGDLFTNTTSDPNNIVFTTFLFNSDSNKFFKDVPSFAYNITQPGEGFYKNKAIRGDIYVPVSEFRSDPTKKIVKFDIFMVDMKGNKSNVITTPQFTLAP